MLDPPQMKTKTRPHPCLSDFIWPLASFSFSQLTDTFCKSLGTMIRPLRAPWVLLSRGMHRARLSCSLFLVWGRRGGVYHHECSRRDLLHLSEPRSVAQSQDRNAHFWAEGFPVSGTDEQVSEAVWGSLAKPAWCKLLITCEPLGAGKSDFLYR